MANMISLRVAALIPRAPRDPAPNGALRAPPAAPPAAPPPCGAGARPPSAPRAGVRSPFWPSSSSSARGRARCGGPSWGPPRGPPFRPVRPSLAGLWSTGPPVYGIYDVYGDSISFNLSTRRDDDVFTFGRVD